MAWFGFRRYAVTGASMAPAFFAGDHLLIRRRSRWPEVGEVVVVADPRSGEPILKRVQQVGPDGIDVRGDNSAASTDSRHFGVLPHEAVLGTVIRRYRRET